MLVVNGGGKKAILIGESDQHLETNGKTVRAMSEVMIKALGMRFFTAAAPAARWRG
jgi:hypothetical protein